MTKPAQPQIIFLGNGPLADAALAVLQESCEVIFHARRATDLEQVVQLKKENPAALAVLASFGVIIRPDVLAAFEPAGILNIHPSLLPKYRGPSPIETAILSGDTEFGVSVMKLAEKMDAGPIYHQETLKFDQNTAKSVIYEQLATAGAHWIAENAAKFTKNITNSAPLPPTTPQNDADATFTPKLATTLSELKPAEKPAKRLLNEIRAYQGWPKSKFTYHNIECTILQAHAAETDENSPLALLCSDSAYLIPDRLQPASKKPMDAKSFINGYLK